MVAPEKAQMEKKDDVRPSSVGRVPANRQQKSERSGITAVFIGLFESDDVTRALFVNSSPNSERLAGLQREVYYKAYAVDIPPDYSSGSSKFICGLPYVFSSKFEKLASCDSVFLISCKFEKIAILNSRDVPIKYSSPVIRGVFHEIRGRFCVLRLSELPPVQLFNSNPEIQVFHDQVSGRPGFSLGNDILLETRAGFSAVSKSPFVCVANFSCTIHMGDFSRNAIRDTPPENFVSSLAERINAHFLIGCDDDPKILTINNKDLLANGGLVKINSFDEFISFTTEVIKRKYIVAEHGGAQADGTTDRLKLKATSFLDNYSIPNGKTVLLWAGRHEGLTLVTAHALCRILNEKGFNPRVIVAANGISLCAPPQGHLRG